MPRIDTIGKTLAEWSHKTREADPPLSALVEELVDLDCFMYDPSKFGCPWMTIHSEMEWRKDTITDLIRHFRKHGNAWPAPLDL